MYLIAGVVWNALFVLNQKFPTQASKRVATLQYCCGKPEYARPTLPVMAQYTLPHTAILRLLLLLLLFVPLFCILFFFFFSVPFCCISFFPYVILKIVVVVK
jgi:hypothetical protein